MNNLVSRVQARLIDKLTDQSGAVKSRVAPPITAAQFARDEKALGFCLPSTLYDLYSQIGNGGFGPGYGLIGLAGGAPNDQGDTAITLYRAFRQRDPDDPLWLWPVGLLPICHWGCAIYSCIDCSHKQFKLRVFDSNAHHHLEPWDDAFFDEEITFAEWIGAWANGANLWSRTY